MKKSVIASIIVIVMALTCLSGLVGCERKSMDDNEPSVTEISSGDIISDTGLQVPAKLNKSNGQYVNLYVENNGTNSVAATINDQSKKTFKPGEKGYIYLEVTQSFLGFDREYMFKVVSAANGGSINIHYEITQDVCSPAE